MSERFFRLYKAHCVSPNRDTLFSLLESGHSLNDRLKNSVGLDFFDIPEFVALKCIRNYFHHQQELRHVVRIIHAEKYPIVADLMTLCLVPRDIINAAIAATENRFFEETQYSCCKVFHWYGQIVNINPALCNFVVLAYEKIKARGVFVKGGAVNDFESIYQYEEDNNIPHLVDGRISTSAVSVDDFLVDVLRFARS